MSLGKGPQLQEEEDLFGEAGTLKKADKKGTEAAAAANTSTEEKQVTKPPKKTKATKDNSMEALRKQMAAKKKKDSKHQISTYLEPAVFEVYKDYGGVYRGDKAELVNTLLKSYFGIED